MSHDAVLRQIARKVLESVTGSLVALYEQIESIAYSVNPLSRGFTTFSFRKSGDIVAWIAGKTGGLYKTKLAKLLWLADLAGSISCRKISVLIETSRERRNCAHMGNAEMTTGGTGPTGVFSGM